eukprot:5653698-Prymnesium_polylepis.2
MHGFPSSYIASVRMRTVGLPLAFSLYVFLGSPAADARTLRKNRSAPLIAASRPASKVSLAALRMIGCSTALPN